MHLVIHACGPWESLARGGTLRRLIIDRSWTARCVILLHDTPTWSHHQCITKLSLGLLLCHEVREQISCHYRFAVKTKQWN